MPLAIYILSIIAICILATIAVIVIVVEESQERQGKIMFRSKLQIARKIQLLEDRIKELESEYWDDEKCRSKPTPQREFQSQVEQQLNQQEEAVYNFKALIENTLKRLDEVENEKDTLQNDVAKLQNEIQFLRCKMM